MRLFIAEKPSLARAIADALPMPQRRAPFHIECGGGDVVAWCAGHILEAAPPEAYGEAYKTWRLDTLPIAPRDWKLEVSAPELLASIARLLRTATRVVHAGDPDREGQLLVDEVLHFLGYKGPVDRLLVRDLSPDAVRRQLAALEPNAKYRPLYESALARQKADWLFGMNMTRLYTLLGRAAGYEGVLSVGRVQTPLLGLIVARDRAIAAFRPAPYFALRAELRAGGEGTFRATWRPGPDVELDPEGRLLAREVAEAVRVRVLGQEGRVLSRTEDDKSEAPPRPYALADLQVDAGRHLGMTAAEVLGACQSLYETHRLVTYPRSDCAYLPEGHHARAREVLAAVGVHAPGLRAAIASADVSLRSKAWDDAKVTAHHAIVPTPAADLPAALGDAERSLYELVCRRYLAQFYPAHTYLQTRIEIEIAGERFAASGRRTVVEGWKALFRDADPDEDTVDHEGEASKDDEAPLPPVRVDEAVMAVGAAVVDKVTVPPRPFTDASLVAAMCGIARFVGSPAIKKLLAETDGIGTPATRAAVIETLFDRGYVTRDKREIVSTDTGRALVGSLPSVATTPDMTAVWEAALRAIAEGAQSPGAFLERVGAQLEQLVADGRTLGRIHVPSAPRNALDPRPAARSNRRAAPPRTRPASKKGRKKRP